MYENGSEGEGDSRESSKEPSKQVGGQPTSRDAAV